LSRCMRAKHQAGTHLKARRVRRCRSFSTRLRANW
jgi:hypothetical protein